MTDTVDKLVIFLAKRDGIDKLVKTFQYVSKLVNWHVEATNPDMSKRFKQWEVASGLSRKAFRTGRFLFSKTSIVLAFHLFCKTFSCFRNSILFISFSSTSIYSLLVFSGSILSRFLTGFNALRRNPGSNNTLRLLAVLSNAGEMVYFFFDHFLWLSRIGTIDANLAKKMSYISAFGEALGYVFFIIADFILLQEGLKAERKLKEGSKEKSSSSEEEKEIEKRIQKIRGDRIMRLMAVAANVADLIIALAEIEPNPFCCHTVSLGISGLVSAWAGWYRNWPS